MSFLLLQSEIETGISAEQGRIWVEQRLHDGTVQTIELTVRQFEEIVSSSTEILDKALGLIP
jgi:hypothetical protein